MNKGLYEQICHYVYHAIQLEVIDLIITDIRFGVALDGIDAMKKIRESSNVKVTYYVTGIELTIDGGILAGSDAKTGKMGEEHPKTTVST